MMTNCLYHVSNMKVFHTLVPKHGMISLHIYVMLILSLALKAYTLITSWTSNVMCIQLLLFLLCWFCILIRCVFCVYLYVVHYQCCWFGGPRGR